MRDSALQSLNLSRDAATAGAPPARRLSRPNNGYSRFVGWMKLVLPAVAIGLLLLVVAWPRIQSGLDRLKLSFGRLDLSEARDLRLDRDAGAIRPPR